MHLERSSENDVLLIVSDFCLNSSCVCVDIEKFNYSLFLLNAPTSRAAVVTMTQEFGHFFFFHHRQRIHARSYLVNGPQDFLAAHFRGCWQSFSPLGKQPGLRTDSLSAPTPTITPTPTTEDPRRPPHPHSHRLLSYLLSLLSFLPSTTQTPTRFSAHTTTLSLCIQDPVGPFPLSNTPRPPPLSLFVCFTVIISLAQKRVGVLAAGQEREAERKRSYMGTELRLNIY